MTNVATGRAVSLQLSTGHVAVPGVDFGYTVTDAIGRQTQYLGSASRITGIAKPESTAADIELSYDVNGQVSTVKDALGTTTYSYSDGNDYRTTTVTDPLNHKSTYRFSLASQLPVEIVDAYGNKTSYDYDDLGRLKKVTFPEGNAISYDYDNRGNVYQVKRFAKPASGLPEIIESAGFTEDCSSSASCNKPIWLKDSAGNRTDISYDASTGAVLSVQAPLVGSDTNRPTRVNTYTYINGVQFLQASSMCADSASCDGTAKQTKTSFTYNEHGLPASISNEAGDGSLASNVLMSYDDVGNVISIDGPLAGAADTSVFRYNADREVVGSITPDPDGTGPAKQAAVRTTYDSRGRVTRSEVGVVAGTDDTSWTAFAAQQQTSTSYDNADRPVVSTLSGGDLSETTSYSYDHQRLDSQTTLIGGGDPDRIIKYSYDDNDRLVKKTEAYGSTAQADTFTTSFTANGKPSAVTDANGNVTSYSYDGFDRLLTTTYPGGTYELLGYDSNSNVTSRRLRDGQTVAYQYDALNRRVYDDNPGANITEADVSYTYDNFGRLLSAIDQNGWSVNTEYDALGRPVREYSNISSTALQYDSGGHLIRQTWGDGFFVTYEYDAAGKTTVIRENGSLALAEFLYDDLGRRTTLTRGNGTVTSYNYDAMSRLLTLSHDLAGSAWDQTYAFTYNGAGQIATRSGSNDSYGWKDATNVSRDYAVNALNQYTKAGDVSFGYDERGNLVSSGSSTYQYNSRNHLVSDGNGQSFYRNPVGQLAQTPGIKYDWVNGQLAQESGDSIQRRYVYGPNPDEVLVWYEGAGTSDRRYLHTDERNSVVAVSNDAGNAIAINSYDEYGIPGTNNQGRFQYTGQAWMPELGMYDYKARMYSPTLGRFMQTDPIGYDDGTNWYNYVGSDPINATDPSGTLLVWACVAGNCGYTDDGRGFGLSPGDLRGLNPGFAPNDREKDNSSGASNPASKDDGLTCKGRATFSAVGPYPQASGDSAFAPGVKPANRTVAIAGAQTFGFGRRALRQGAAASIRISPEGLDDVLSATGGPKPPYTVSDYGDANIRNAPGTRFDIYRFATKEGALAFGKRTVPYTVKVPAGGHCPPGASAK
ncbi:RHS repeat domain-containing protein [Sphingomonas sp. RIT328]|uniref:RHS repeat domain-containing protein n=1 Tax=Sphingomonas sp. RIT328 TaxID=1470591 RepID=UPI0013768F8A|nr:RHS repeat-associated core domain-containing protein [Sphingomonas sp. RIT328]